MQRTVFQKNNGFTLLELLVVIAIIGLLAVIVATSISESRAKSRDAMRVQTLKELQKAIELYYAANGIYPALPTTVAARSRDNNATDPTCIDSKTANQGWCSLLSAIQPYYTGGIDDPSDTGNFRYWYDTDGATPQKYGLMAILETSAFDNLANNDEGYYCQSATPGCTNAGVRGYELGDAPKTCGATNWTGNSC